MTVAGILAGGRSTRMGVDKAALPWRGTSLLGHVCATARAAGLAPVVIGRAHGVSDHDHPDVTYLLDECPDQGPLGGLVSILAARDTDVLLLSCDLPLITADALRWLMTAAMTVTAAHGCVPSVDGRLQPCCGLYRPAILPLARERLLSGRRSLHGLIDMADIAQLTCPARFAANLRDVDTPADWQRLTGA